MAGIKEKIIPITELRRNFGEVTVDLAKYDRIVLTKGGWPFAVLKSAPEIKRGLLREAAGRWEKTPLDDDKLWREAGKKKSRHRAIKL